MNDSIIYLDYNATTPVDPRVLEVMLPFFRDQFGNAASRQHRLGCQAAESVEKARTQVAEVIGAHPREIVWTSGATESNNIALKGVAASPVHSRKGGHIITARTEHKAVLDPCGALEKQGFVITRLPVNERGLISLDQLRDSFQPDTILVSLMHANNETGVVYPIEEIGRMCRRRGVLFHTDATQSFGKIPIDVNRFAIDLLSLSAHKIYGAKGVGALFVRRRQPRVRCVPLFEGGGHERGLRSGTLNVPGIVSLGAAARICSQEMAAEQKKIGFLRDYLESRLCRIDGTTVNGGGSPRLANTLNVSFERIDIDRLMRSLPDIAISSSSACTSATLQPSYVLGAMGKSDEAIRGSARFSLGRFTTREEIERAADALEKAIRQMRSRPPQP